MTRAVALNGAAPRNLGVVRNAQVNCVDDAVELILSVERAGDLPRPVRVTLPKEVARDLALSLVRSAAKLGCLFYAVLVDFGDVSTNLGRIVSLALSTLGA
jgi:hypothetical protein